MLSLLIIAMSCTDSRPKGLMGEEKMKKVLWEYLNADVYTREYLTDSTKEDTLLNAKLQKEIFKKNGVTADEFYTTYNYYTDHPKEMLDMLDSMAAQQKRKDTLYNTKIPMPVLDAN